jgi:hypothetical protein
MEQQPDAAKRRAKLDQLIEIEGFESEEALLAAVITDSVSPAICLNENCDYTAEMEPDQDRGFCEACGTNSVASALILAGII